MGSDGYLDSRPGAALNGAPTSDSTWTFHTLVQQGPLVLVVLVGGEAEGRNIIDASRCYFVQNCRDTNLHRRDCLRDNPLDSVKLRTLVTLSQ